MPKLENLDETFTKEANTNYIPVTSPVTDIAQLTIDCTAKFGLVII